MSNQLVPADRDPGQTPKRKPIHWALLTLFGFLTVIFFVSSWTTPKKVPYSTFLEQLSADNIAGVSIQGLTVTGSYRKAIPPADPPTGQKSGESSSKKEKLITQFQCMMPPQVGESWLEELRAQGVEINVEPQANYDDLFMIVLMVGLFLLFFFGWSMIRRTRDSVMGGSMLGGVTKSPARLYDPEAQGVDFEDVAGLGGIKKDLQEIVLFLKDPEKFRRLGAHVPKGVLLMGPPGTGKTLLARAVAGEAGVPFFSINGSEFIQLFVGVGAGRVRDMFKTAQDSAPAILFIDEIDAVGRQRGAGMGGGHDEREQTLNQILSEMDGFSPGSTVIVLAATNRPDVLDPALLRPGRFDRHVMVDRPSIVGRRELFELHSRKVPITEEVDFNQLARATVGLTGADIRNLVNEAALWATRHDKDKVGMDDFEHARDKVLMGAKREEVLTEQEKKICAYHEAGHALVAWLVPGCDRVHKVTIVPRGRALGVTQMIPDEDRYNMGQREMLSQLAMTLGGRAAEKMRFDEYSAGAESDLKRATDLTRRMVTRWGMSERIGPVTFSNQEEQPFLGRELAHEHRIFSEKTAQVIDEEMAKILRSAADHASQILGEHRHELDLLAAALLDREILDYDDIAQLIGKPANAREDTGNAKRPIGGAPPSSGTEINAASSRAEPN